MKHRNATSSKPSANSAAVQSIIPVDDFNWRQFTSAPCAILAVGVTGCPACRSWLEELESWAAIDGAFPGARVGKITLDTAHSDDFKRANDWLDHIPGLPFTAVFVHGEPVTSLAGSGVHRLESRLHKVREATELGRDSAPASQPSIGAHAPCTTR